MSIEAMKQAREAFISMGGWNDRTTKAFRALDQAIAEADKQEPVAWLKVNEDSWTISLDAEPDHISLYTHPQQRTWVGLTDEEKQEWIDAMPYDPQPRHCMILVNVIEAKLKEKNT